jgi:TPP-dependent pyruvate/acetoin dehydrogenase alpha subunit
LRERSLVSDLDLSLMQQRIDAEIDEAVAFAKASPFPGREQLTADVYAPPGRI